MPEDFSMCELGVFRGATLGLTAGLAGQYNKRCHAVGVSPLNGEGLGIKRDYTDEVFYFFDMFTNKDANQKLTLIKHLTEDKEGIEKTKQLSPYDIMYIDAGHERRHITNDILHYAPMTKVNGYLLIDDSCNNFNMIFGYFQGIIEVTEVTEELLPHNKRAILPTGEEFEFIGSVVHLRLYQRVK
jgi:hypothetical protein